MDIVSNSETASLSAALTQKRTLQGGGLLQFGDLRLLEDGSERRGALDSDHVAPDTAKHRWGWSGERVGVSMGADIKANTIGAAAHLSLEILVSLRTAASAEAPLSPMELTSRLRVRGGARIVRKQLCQGR